MDTAYYNGKEFSFAGCVREPSALPQAAPFRPGEIPDVSKLQANAGKEFSFFKTIHAFSHTQSQK
jgi:hypothetical protein